MDRLISLALTLAHETQGLLEQIEKIIQALEKVNTTEARELKSKYEIQKAYCIGNGHFVLHYCDIMTAIKYLDIPSNDWDSRFFIRRIYTLFHETRHSSLNLIGQSISKLGKDIDKVKIEALKKSKKELDKFLDTNDEEFVEIRNKCEAHKDKDFKEQLKVIENLNIATSKELISEAIPLLNSVLGNFKPILEELNSKVSSSPLLSKNSSSTIPPSRRLGSP